MIEVLVRKAIYSLISASLLLPNIYKGLLLFKEGENIIYGDINEILIGLYYIAYCSLLGTVCICSWRKRKYCKFILAFILLIHGLFMVPWFFSPWMDVLYRIMLGTLGILWIASAAWVVFESKSD